MELIIKNKSQSFEQIVIDLNVYLRSLPDWESWQDYYKTGSGQTIIELIAGLGAQLFFLINIQRQETYLQTAMNRSSVIGIAQMLGYSAGRGNAVKATITVRPDTTGVFNKFSIMGTCKGVDIIMNESVLLQEGEEKQLNVILGTLKRDYCKVESTALQPFRMTGENVSEDFMLYKTSNAYSPDEYATLKEDMEFDKSGWTELPVSDKIIDLSEDKWVAQTNVLSSVDLFYLNEGTTTNGKHAYRYRQDDTLILDYVELSDTEFELSDLDFLYGEVISVDSVASYNAVESISSIKVNAPLANEVQAMLRARNDGRKLIQQRGKNFISAVNSFDISPEIVDVTYIKNDFSLLSTIEYDELYDFIYNKARPFGIQMQFISPPVRAILELEVDVKLTNPLVRNSVTESIQTMIESLQNQFIVDAQGDQTTLDLEALEEDIETLYGVKIARVYTKFPTYESDKYYRIGQFVSFENSPGFMYKLERIIRTSGGQEPSWPTEEGALVYDGDIVWECYKQEAGFGDTWTANSEYNVASIVLPREENGYMYKFKTYFGTSAKEQPELIEGQSVIYDGELIWYKIAKNASAVEWAAETKFAIGDIVNISADPSSSYQMILTRIKHSDIDSWPSGDGLEITQGKAVWKCLVNRDKRGDYRSPLLTYDWNQYLHVDYDLTITE